MVYIPTDWRDLPDQSTPLSASAIKTMESKLAAYAESVAAPGINSISGFLNPTQDFNMKSDGNIRAGSINSGAVLLTGAWANADIGKSILVPGAGVAGADLVTKIDAVNPGVSATLHDPAGTTAAGVSCIYGTDDGPAIQNAINVCLDRRGGNIILPTPVRTTAPNTNTYTIIATPLVIPHWQGGKIMSSSGGSDGAFPLLAYLPETGNLLHATSCFRLILEGITFLALNSRYSGDLVLFDSDGSDNMACLIKHCGFLAHVADQTPTARSHLRLDKTIFSRVAGSTFESGATSALEIGPNYGVSLSINDQCNFSHTVNHVYINSADCESLAIEGNTFEPTYGGKAGAIVGAVGNRCRGGLVIAKNWFGDMNIGGRCNIENIDAWAGGAEVHGNMFGDPIDQAGSGFGGAHFGKLSGGPWDIHSNMLLQGVTLMDLTPCTGADVGPPTGVHFHDNAVIQNNNVFLNGSWATVPDLKFDDTNVTASGIITKKWPWNPSRRDPFVGAAYYPHTLDWSDLKQVIYSVANGTQMDITVPPESALFFPAGSVIEFVQGGAGKIHFIPGAGVTINSLGGLLNSGGQYSHVRLDKTSVANVWNLSGTLS